MKIDVNVPSKSDKSKKNFLNLFLFGMIRI